MILITSNLLLNTSIVSGCCNSDSWTKEVVIINYKRELTKDQNCIYNKTFKIINIYRQLQTTTMLHQKSGPVYCL